MRTGGGGRERVLAIGLNQTIDRTLGLDLLAPGRVLRAATAAVTAGGKAVNVSRAALTLGAPASLVGPFPQRGGALAIELLEAEGIDVRAVAVPGELRGTTVMIEPGGRTTVINEPGPPLDAAGLRLVLDAVAAAIDHEMRRSPRLVMAISGSAPPGTPADAHRTLINIGHDRGGLVAVDVTGARLLAAADAGADLVSPNLVEAEQTLALASRAEPALASRAEQAGAGAGERPGAEIVDHDGEDIADLVGRAGAAAAALVARGAGAALVSVGRHGVAYHSSTTNGVVAAPAVDAINLIGAGDALLGAALVALERGDPIEVAVRRGVAYAAASVAHAVAGYAEPTLVDRLTASLLTPHPRAVAS